MGNWFMVVDDCSGSKSNNKHLSLEKDPSVVAASCSWPEKVITQTDVYFIGDCRVDKVINLAASTYIAKETKRR
jgi:hypothetical protein